MSIRFRAVVAGAPFSIGRAYAGLGVTRDAVRFDDFRMFVSKLRLRTESGPWTDLRLIPNGRSQDERSALLDFSSRERAQTQVVGSMPAAAYTELAFELGVPFGQNHQDVSRARPPFDVTSMFWAWRNGYKFLRLEGESETSPPHKFAVHIGSTGCRGANTPVDVPSVCAAPNRGRIHLRQFDPKRAAIVVSVDKLLEELALSGDAADDGCESANDDEDCRGVFAVLGVTKPLAGLAFEVGVP